MGLKDVLQKLRLVEAEGEPAATPVTGGERAGGRASRPNLAEIVAAVPPARIDAAALPETETVGEDLALPDPAAVYRAAGIAEPAHGYSALKVLELLESPELAALEAKAKAGAVAGFLRRNPAGAVPIAEIVADAVARDQALDRCEEFLAQKLGARRDEREREDAALEHEIAELTRRHRERIEANRRATTAEAATFERWRATKRAEELRLAAAVTPFVDGDPISTTPNPRNPNQRAD